MIGRNGKKTAVLANGGVLPDEYDYKVLFLQNVAAIKSQRERLAIGGALAEVAAQTRVPLSLAAGLIRRLPQFDADKEGLDGIVQRVICQLRKVEMTYDRVLASHDPSQLLETRAVRVDFGRLVEEVVRELSKSEQDELNVRLSPEPSLVLGDVYQLGFAVQSILAYFLRSKPADGRVDIEVSGETNEVTVRITGPDSPIEAAPETDVLALAEEQARASIALGESSLKHIIEVNHNGRYSRYTLGNGLLRFELSLSAAVPQVSRGRMTHVPKDTSRL